MGEVKRWASRSGMDYAGPFDRLKWVSDDDYARLERERDELASEAARIEHAVREHIAGMQVKIDMQNAELTRLRAVEKAANAFLDSYERDPSPAVVYARMQLSEAVGRK